MISIIIMIESCLYFSSNSISRRAIRGLDRYHIAIWRDIPRIDEQKRLEMFK